MKELLEKLKSLDPTTYKRFDETEIHEDFYSWNLTGDIQEAWLQACLQEACERREWFYGQFSMANPGPFYCDISDANNVDNQWTGTGNSPAEAILRAYIAACEATA